MLAEKLQMRFRDQSNVRHGLSGGIIRHWCLVLLSVFILASQSDGVLAGWSGWDDNKTGGELTSAPAVTSWGPVRIDVFVRGRNHKVWHKWSNDGGESWKQGKGWELRDGFPVDSGHQPACISLEAFKIDCVIWKKLGDFASLTHTIVRLPLKVPGELLQVKEETEVIDISEVVSWGPQPTLTSWGPNRVDLFVRLSTNNSLAHYWNSGSMVLWDLSGWQSHNLGGELTSKPSCISPAVDRVACFGRGKNKHLWQIDWRISDPKGWSKWSGSKLVKEVTSAPSVTSWGPTRLDLFARGMDGAMWHKWSNNGGKDWSGWKSRGGRIVGEPACISIAPNRIDCFARGLNDRLWHAKCTSKADCESN